MVYEDWTEERFDLRDGSLPMLALESAIDIDDYISGRDTKDESIKHLSKLLHDITQEEKPIASLPNNCLVLGYAISSRENFKDCWKGKNTGDLVLQINLLAKDLRNFRNIRISQQKVLFDFCVNLSKEIALYQSEYYSGDSRLVA